MSVHIPAAHGADRRDTCKRHPALGERTAPTAPTRFSDDDMLLLLLISTWELYTARPAPPSPPVDMTEQELIEYWTDPADDPPNHPAPAPRPGKSA